MLTVSTSRFDWNRRNQVWRLRGRIKRRGVFRDLRGNGSERDKKEEAESERK
jgi:hypothetical protein